MHAALAGDLDETALRGPDGLTGWITLLRTVLGEPTFTVQIGPIVDGDLLCGRRHVQGHYAGGMPGATVPHGTPVAFTGTDVLRVGNGLLAEYWINSDVHVMAAQLGITS